MKSKARYALLIIAALAIIFGGCNAGVVSNAPSATSHTSAKSFTEADKYMLTEKNTENTTAETEETSGETTKPETTAKAKKENEETSAASKNNKNKKKKQKQKKDKKEKEKEEKEKKQDETTSELSDTCTITVECKNIFKHMEDLKEGHEQYLPSDGYIVYKTAFPYVEGETAYDLLMKAADKYALKITERQTGFGPYIAGINNIDEKDVGPTSGWTYLVNGKFASTGCGNYKLKRGDNIVFTYSCSVEDVIFD